jgi:hypothetical protein
MARILTAIIVICLLAFTVSAIANALGFKDELSALVFFGSMIVGLICLEIRDIVIKRNHKWHDDLCERTLRVSKQARQIGHVYRVRSLADQLACDSNAVFVRLIALKDNDIDSFRCHDEFNRMVVRLEERLVVAESLSRDV